MTSPVPPSLTELGSCERPTEASALAALSEVLGDRAAEALWSVAVHALALSRPVDEPADLRRVADHLMETMHLARVAGRSLKVRVITYQALAGVLP